MVRRSLRRLVDEMGSRLARFVLEVFFRDVEVLGRARVPRGVPLLVIANHVNNLIDPMVIMGFAGVRPRFLAKSTLWRHPIVAPALLLLGALPVYRRRDGAPVERNFETFARCRIALARGETIAIFPEGYSHNEPGAVPLKTGAARIALEAGAHGALGLRVLPIGIVYEDKEHFRSRVLVQVGEPIDPAPELAAYAGEPRAAVKALTARIAAGLESVTLPFASWEEARLIDRAVDLAVEGDPGALPLSERWSLWRSFIGRYAELEKSDPERAQRLVTALRAYDEARRRLGLRESDLAAWPDRGWRARARDLLEFAIKAPGVLLNWLPYRLPSWIADRLDLTPDEPASYKVMGALLFFPVWWALEAAVARALAGPWAALAVAVAAPLAGLVSLRIHDRQKRRPLAVGTRFAERAALRDSRAALRRQIRDVASMRA
ncbi:MAG TPA: lysophospholipid acyltransferase family protein [Vicinamibacteria bacterium]|nr:lysophospholipid acyltransferase family protein [Vicinamibacteria bacterium]